MLSQALKAEAAAKADSSGANINQESLDKDKKQNIVHEHEVVSASSPSATPTVAAAQGKAKETEAEDPKRYEFDLSFANSPDSSKMERELFRYRKDEPELDMEIFKQKISFGIQGMDRELLAAAYGGRNDLVEEALQNNGYINILDFHLNTPLHYACRYNHIDVARTLIKKRARVDIANFKGYTPILEAAENGHAEMVRIMIMEAHANIKVKNNKGQDLAELALEEVDVMKVVDECTFLYK